MVGTDTEIASLKTLDVLLLLPALPLSLCCHVVMIGALNILFQLAVTIGELCSCMLV